MGSLVPDTGRRVWQRPCVKHKQARAWPELKEAPCAARGQEVNPLREKGKPLEKKILLFRHVYKRICHPAPIWQNLLLVVDSLMAW